jgi:hypothetical protein
MLLVALRGRIAHWRRRSHLGILMRIWMGLWRWERDYLVVWRRRIVGVI